MNLESIGRNIRYYRQAAGLSQKQLSEKIETTWEMISRYETGKSSPMRRIMRISEALRAPLDSLLSDDMITDQKHHYQFNSIPLIEKAFSNITQALEQTKTYYTAPDWIVRSPGKPFALSSDLLHIETSHITPNGILYAIREKPSASNDIVIIQRDNVVVVTQYSSALSAKKVLATVIAFEKRFR
jgi:transcriptional regulator with XRE-family HTH domain